MQTLVQLVALALLSGWAGFELGSRRQRTFIMRPEMSGDEEAYCPWVS